MWRCAVCESEQYREEKVDEVFQIDGKRVIVDGIPARICVRCGDVSFTAEVAEQVRRIARGEESPAHPVQVDMYAFSE